jgi:hypothetical protein
MLMIDILRLPGVDDARRRLIYDGLYVTGPVDPGPFEAHADRTYVDDLIRTVAEAVEAEYTRRCGEIVPDGG